MKDVINLKVKWTCQKMKIFCEIIHNCYSKIFYENWPFWFAGVLIGIMSILTFTWERPWGVAGGLKNWGDSFFYMTGLYSQKPSSPFFTASSILTIGLLYGSFTSALMSKQFALRPSSIIETIKGILGGSTMGIGAAMAKGCNIGGFYSAISSMSLGGICMMIGLFFGANLGIRYLYWELDNIPSSPTKKIHNIKKKRKQFNFFQLQPFLGFIGLLLAFVSMWFYAQNAYTKIGGLLLFGILFGVILHRSRFCFVRFFRDPFMSGEANMVRAVSYSIIISLIGFAILKWTGLRGEMVFVTKTFWFGGLFGGAIFGFGMVIAGGCGSGSIWRAGEGHIKLILSTISFALTTSIVNKIIQSYPEIKKIMGVRVFLPEYITYGWSIFLIICIFCFCSLLFTWNERTEKFIIEM